MPLVYAAVLRTAHAAASSGAAAATGGGGAAAAAAPRAPPLLAQHAAAGVSGNLSDVTTECFSSFAGAEERFTVM